MNKNPIPFINIQPVTDLIREDIVKVWRGCLDKSTFIGGRAVEKLEDVLSKRLKVKHVIACADGTDAIVIALAAAGVKSGMRVALPNLTFWATYEAVAQLGAEPVLVDIDPEDLQMSYLELCNAHKQFGLSAAILVHLLGWTSSQLDTIRSWCRTEGIILIEDGAQSFGVEYQNDSGVCQNVFSDAYLGTISFYPAKVFGGCMDGGAITTNDDKLAETCRSMANHGRLDHYRYSYVGWNSRMSTLQAEFLLALETKISDILIERRARLQDYQRFITDPRIVFYKDPLKVIGNAYLAVLRIPGRRGDELKEKLLQSGVVCGRVYPETIGEQIPARNALRLSDLKHSENFCREVLNLPLFYGITSEECRWASEALKKVL